MNKLSILFLIALLLLFAGACAKVQTELTFMVGGAPSEVAYWEKLVEEFEQHTGIEVRVIRQPTDSDQRRQGLIVPLHAGLPDPDVFLMDIVWIVQFVTSGWLEPLDPYIEKSNLSIEPFFENIIQFADTYDNTLWALPVYVDGGLLYYRKDLLDKYGYKRPPLSWKELVSCAAEIQEKERKHNPNFWGFVWQGFQYEGLVCNFLEFSASHGGGLSPQNDDIRINTPENSKALHFMHDLIHRYKISPPHTYTEIKEEEARLAFQRGNALFERNWPYAWALHQNDGSLVKNKTGITLLPHSPEGKSVSALGGWHIGISGNSDRKDDAWELVRFITSFDVGKKLVDNLGWTLGRKDVYEDSELIKKHPHFKDLKDIYAKAVSRPNLPYYSRFSEIIQRHVHACLSGKISPENALAEMEKNIVTMRKSYEK